MVNILCQEYDEIKNSDFMFMPRNFLRIFGLIAVLTLSFQPAGAKNQSEFLSKDEITELKRSKPCANIVKKVFLLRDRMKEGVETGNFDLKLLENNEMIKDRKGSYYLVNLKDAKKRQRILFNNGTYIVSRANTRMRRSLTSFVREVLAVIHGNVPYEIMVRGSASSTKMRRRKRLKKGYVYNEVEYLKQVGDGQYNQDALDIREIGKRFGNDDLPFLRAAYLQDIVYRFFPVQRPLVLESQVDEDKQAQARSAELLLFVDW